MAGYQPQASIIIIASTSCICILILPKHDCILDPLVLTTQLLFYWLFAIYDKGLHQYNLLALGETSILRSNVCVCVCVCV